jgi:ABC-2 type transport system ATP-binding protein
MRGTELSDFADGVVVTHGLTCRFGAANALDDVDFGVEPGEIHALLGPNGAGKTTLIRTLLGLLTPTDGSVEILGLDPARDADVLRPAIGFVPSGDRSFYLRISGLENLAFFARLHGMRRREAVKRSHELLDHVGLADAARKRVGVYSHGMQKRLSVARALLGDPRVLLVDEATHDLDPEGAERVRTLVRDIAQTGAAVVWATQRLEEILGLADRVTLLHQGRVCFAGGVHELMAQARPGDHVVRLRNGRPGDGVRTAAEAVLAGRASVAPVREGDPEHYVISLGDGVVLGDALAVLAGADLKVLSVREHRSEIENAFRALTSEAPV